MTFKFATRNFLGKIVRCYSVDVQDLPANPPIKKQIGHHILVVDASGSMYGDIGSIKEKIRKMLTLDEYRDSEMLVSLFSYSSSGDCIEHFARVPVGDIVKSKNTKAQREIGSLAARGMTCMTQAFEAAFKLAQDGDKKGELTAVSLHTDGYFNDPSPSAEFRKIDTLIEKFKTLKSTFVNTIGYRDYCDFAILGKIANALSGKCFQAKDLKSFYDSIYDTSQLISGQTTPAIYLEKSGKFDYQVFHSSDGKIVGGAGDLSICGVKAEAAKAVYRFKEITETAFNKMNGPEHTVAGLAFARTQLAEGRLNVAKYALAGVGFLDRATARAISPTDLVTAAVRVEEILAEAEGPSEYLSKHSFDAFDFSKQKITSVPKFLSILAEHTDGFLLNIDLFAKLYKRRGLKRLSGVWVDGKFVKPNIRTELRDKDEYVHVSGFEFNRNNATINMMIAQPCKLLKDGAEVKELAGLKLALSDYKQYTIVGDGNVNVEALFLRITNKLLYKKLIEAGCDFIYDPTRIVEFRISNYPLVDYGASFDKKDYAGLAERLAILHTADKLFSALIKGKTAEMSAEQVAELKQHYITPNLYFSAPTANPYTDLKAAIAAGDVDVRVGYSVIVGDKDFIDPTDLYSANEFLARWYECEDVADPKKPKMTEWFNKDFKVKHKQLSSRVKVGPVDKLMAKVFDEFFGLAGKPFASLKGWTDIDVLGKWFKGVLSDKNDEISLDALTAIRREIGIALDRVYREEVTPLVFYIGASGLIPDDFGDLQAMNAEQLKQKYPDVSLSKDMREEGTFYDLGNGAIVTVVRRQEYFSTEAGVEKAKEIEKTAAVA